MTTTAMLDKTLWAVSIHGPDDLIPVADYLTALRFANRFNEWWQQQKTAKPLHPYDPRMWAVPVGWTGDADQHAERVKNPSPDYAPFLSAPLSHAAGDVAGLVEEIKDWANDVDIAGTPAQVGPSDEELRRVAASLLAISARAEAAEARVKEMEAALEPFARLADKHHSGFPDEEFALPLVRVGQLRRARSILAARSLSPIKEAGNV